MVIHWQGCAEAGLCYPPEKMATKVDIAVPR
ncbi:protein-disulfide reductase DsbD family protein [Psychrobacter sp. A3]|nr:protein-disulfide reductase DsbD domain-containing protein [Psychrobacter sp. A3]MDE0492251.1 protein-disulfide reductase DsbD family protein [Psychrobacter sp. A3]